MSRADEPVRHPGNSGLLRALDLSVLSTYVGLPLHIHAEGLRGTGKTTIMRSIRSRLPRILRIKGCLYNCLPWVPHCPRHASMSPEEVAAEGTEWITMPFREISHSAKVGTVAGSIDLSRLTDAGRPEAALLPGTIPQANRGVIFVDEINRLADTAPELADILLDVMGTKPGRLQVEETGMPCVAIPVSVSVWAASNPDEDPGPLEDIRKQLSDRFDFVVAMERPSEVATVREVLRSTRARYTSLFETALSRPPDAVFRACSATAGAAGEDERWRDLGEAARRTECSDAVEELIASLYIDFGLESLRAVEAIHHGAHMNSALEGRSKVTATDVLAVAPGALQHRVDVSSFARIMDHLGQRAKAEVGAESEAAGGRTGESDNGERAEDAISAALAGGAEAPVDEAASLAASTGSTAGRPEGGSPAGRHREPDATSTRTGARRHPRPGWLSLCSLVGLRALSPGGETRESSALAPALPGAAPGRGQGAQAGAGGSGRGRPGQGRSSGPAGQDEPVAPPHRARSLADIIRDMDGMPPGFRDPRAP
ncbi:MAG: magnesium chelatase [Bacillota bacterium]|nr:MAG: magnesium chelatase [Bacillota bacterium]